MLLSRRGFIASLAAPLIIPSDGIARLMRFAPVIVTGPDLVVNGDFSEGTEGWVTGLVYDKETQCFHVGTSAGDYILAMLKKNIGK